MNRVKIPNKESMDRISILLPRSPKAYDDRILQWIIGTQRECGTCICTNTGIKYWNYVSG